MVAGGIGVPGGTAAAVVTLADDPTGQAVSAMLTMSYPLPPLDSAASDCALAERLAGTHRLTAAVPLPGMLDLVVAPIAATPPLGEGELVRCDFESALGTPAGTAALTLAASVDDAAGDPIPVDTADGAIIIIAPPSTPTMTPTLPLTPIPIPTDTPTATPTATIFHPTVLANNFGGCAITAAPAANALPPIGGAALLLALRRRRRG